MASISYTKANQKAYRKMGFFVLYYLSFMRQRIFVLRFYRKESNILDKVGKMWYYMHIFGGDCICLRKKDNIKYILC